MKWKEGANTASLALQRTKHQIKQEIGFLHTCFSSIYHKKHKTKSVVVARTIVTLFWSRYLENKRLTVINFNSAYIVSILLCFTKELSSHLITGKGNSAQIMS